MRDKNLTLQKFNIQLNERVTDGISTESDWFRRNHVSASPTRLSDNPKEVRVFYPKDFRLLRSLAIIQWYLPDDLHWLVLVDLKELTFSWLNDKQKLEIAILLSSKSNMLVYLYETQRYSGSEIFGNILGNDLHDLFRHMKVRELTPRRPKRTVRRRGYRDHGSRKPDHKWLPDSDFTFTAEQNKRERHLELLQRTETKLLSKLRLLLRDQDLE